MLIREADNIDPQPAAGCRVGPLPPETGGSSRCRCRSMEWGEYRRRRFGGGYADHGAELQISQYRM